MKKLKLFVENFLVYGLGGIISKLVPLLMVPIVTRLLPDTGYYGLSDLTNTIISFASAIAIMGMRDAMFRLFFEKDDEKFKKTVCSTTFVFTFVSSVVICLLLIFLKNPVARLFYGDSVYYYLIYFASAATLFGATDGIISAPTRMQNKRKIYLVTNTVSPLISYAVAIPLILRGYYIIALPLAYCISSFVIEISFFMMNHKWFDIKLFDTKLLKKLLVIAVPLMPNFLVYWVFNSSDRLMISNLIGVGAAGIYAVSSKLGHISHLIYTAFAGGWQYFSFSTMKEKNQVETNSKIFEYLGIISMAVTTIMCACSYTLFRILFEAEYLIGYISAPYLFLAPLLQLLFQVIGNQFLVVKKTWPSIIILSFGALSNVALNLVLIPVLGIEGASIATLVGYIITDVLASVVLTKMHLLVINQRFIASTAIFILTFIVWRFLLSERLIPSLILSAFFIATVVFLYRNDIRQLIDIINKRKEKTV